VLLLLRNLKSSSRSMECRRTARRRGSLRSVCVRRKRHALLILTFLRVYIQSVHRQRGMVTQMAWLCTRTLIAGAPRHAHRTTSHL